MIKNKVIYSLTKRFPRNHNIQIYMYGFMYVDPETIP